MKHRMAIYSLILLTLFISFADGQNPKTAQKSSAGFSFAVYGDSRSMMYLPYKEDEQDSAKKLMVELFSLVVPEKVSEEVVNKYVKLIYDSASKELVQLVMPFATASEVATMRIDKGWVTYAAVEDTKLLPGVSTPMFRLEGGDWVAREVVRSINSGRAKFIVNTGDMVWWGRQADKPSDNPYWGLVNEDLIKQLPKPDKQLLDAGLYGRVFPAVGNHEVWADSDIEGLLNAFPYLKKMGVTSKNLIYKFDFQGARFIFLWTGKYDYRSPTDWGATRPPHDEQMDQMKIWLNEAKAKGIKKIFISFHSPVFARAGFGAIPDNQNPHKIIASYAKDLDIVVFNGHVHTTEIYEVDGVKYLLLGGGGAEQDPILPGRTQVPNLPANYPMDQYWMGAPPKEEYNYLLVDVKPGQKTRFTLNRFRPWSSKPFETATLFNDSK
jgi:hypothetical protein